MSVYVIDASVAAKWFADEEHKAAAQRALAGEHELHAPDFLLLEMDNVFCTWLQRGTLDEADVGRARAALRDTPLKMHPFLTVLDPAYAIANQTARSVYDCVYVALAASLDCQVATADRRLYNALGDGPFGQHVLWVEDIE